VPKNGHLVGCDVIWSGAIEITFQRDLLPPSLGHVILKHKDLHSVFSIVSRLQVGWSRVRVLAGTKNCSLLQNVRTLSGVHPASYARGTRALSLRFEACHLPLSCAEVKNEWRNTSIPPSGLLGLAQTNVPFWGGWLAETSVYIGQSTGYHITEDSSLQSHCFEILKSHQVICVTDLTPGCASEAPKHGAAVPHATVKRRYVTAG